jgi:hypothetical protein
VQIIPGQIIQSVHTFILTPSLELLFKSIPNPKIACAGTEENDSIRQESKGSK